MNFNVFKKIIFLSSLCISSTFALDKKVCQISFWEEATLSSVDELQDDGLNEYLLNGIRCNENGDTITHMAASSNSDHLVIEALIDLGADTSIKNNKGLKAVDLIIESDKPEIFEILSAAGEAKMNRSMDNLNAELRTDESEDRSGEWYVGFGLGTALGKEKLASDINDTDVGTGCDQYLTGTRSLDDPNCVRGLDRWINSFNLSSGGRSSGSIHLGYRFKNNLRFEVEYFSRTQEGSPSLNGRTKLDVSGAPKINKTVGAGVDKIVEMAIDEEMFKNVRSNNFFGNIYYDFNTGRLRSYVGLGAGISAQEVEYSAKYGRHTDVEFIKSLGRPHDAAGRITTADKTLSNNVLSYQALAGFDFEVNDNVSFGVKGRYVRSQDFVSEETEWDRLRSHSSLVGPSTPGHPPVVYNVTTSGSGYWSAGADVKFTFGGSKKKNKQRK